MIVLLLYCLAMLASAQTGNDLKGQITEQQWCYNMNAAERGRRNGTFSG